MKIRLLLVLSILGFLPRLISQPNTDPVKGIAIKDANTMLAIAGNKVYKSTNGAVSFPTTDLTMSNTANGIHLDEDGYGFIVGDAGSAYKITPGVSSNDFVYTLVATDANPSDDIGTGIPILDLISVSFTDRKMGHISLANGTVLKTVDGGLHWKQLETGSGAASPLVALATPQAGTLVDGANTVYYLSDKSMLFSSRFWYDELGRMVLSQNAKQFNIENYLTAAQIAALPNTGKVGAYSYTLYDDIGRIIEVGELLTRAEVPTFKHETMVEYAAHQSYITTGVQREITKTYYDRVKYSNIAANFTQENLRPRVASVTYQDAPGNNYDRATHYSYDIHGNVNALIQEIKAGGETLKKRLDYEYDLLSGNVNLFYYQKDKEDQLIHKYEYDGDNRIANVQTSRDGIVWDTDAAYDYYAHGPLVRTKLGDKQIEENNYAYTVQGWIKGMNGANFSYALGYFDEGTNQDYTAIGTATHLATPVVGGKSLYNGNIATTASNTPQFAGQANLSMQYNYDQLNRLTASAALPLGGAGGGFATAYTYDAGGNLTNLKRHDAGGDKFDDIDYILHNTENGYDKNTNKLRHVDDLAGAYATEPTDDIEDQNPNNYQFDDIGNLIKDVSEEIENIEWTVYGKIRKIQRTGTSTKPDMEFAYDASGNRIAKIITQANGDASITFYVRDPQGNVLSIYEKENIAAVKLTEQYLFGSSRLATFKPTYTSDQNMHMTGQKNFEITDHLGNVRVTLNDKGKTSSATDYYPGGSPMPGRNFVSSTGYRYGFNGQEKDDEVKGASNSLDFGARIYDPRLGLWLSLDPLMTKYPNLSPYNFSANNPILFRDIDGRDFDEAVVKKSGESSEALIALVTHIGLHDASARDANFVSTMHPPCVGCDAINLYPNIYYNDDVGKTWSTSMESQITLAAHELSHYDELFVSNQDFGKNGVTAWYINYAVEGSEKGYENIETESNAFKYEDLVSSYLHREFEGEKNYILNLFENKELSDVDRARSINTAFAVWEEEGGQTPKFNPSSTDYNNVEVSGGSNKGSEVSDEN